MKRRSFEEWTVLLMWALVALFALYVASYFVWVVSSA